jgi:hypothetical protein
MTDAVIDVRPSVAESPGEGGASGQPATTEFNTTERLLASLAVPEKLLLGALRDARLRVVQPFSVLVRREDDHWILQADEINEFGFGKSLSDAIADLQSAIAELHLSLEADQSRLGSDLQSVWELIQKKVRRRESRQ